MKDNKKDGKYLKHEARTCFRKYYALNSYSGTWTGNDMSI